LAANALEWARIGAHSDGTRAKRERGSEHGMSEERGMMGSNDTAKPKTIKDLDLNDSRMDEIKVAYTPHFLNQFRSPRLSNACINHWKSWTLYAIYLSKFISRWCSSVHKIVETNHWRRSPVSLLRMSLKHISLPMSHFPKCRYRHLLT
jgi:hypothetical protein